MKGLSVICIAAMVGFSLSACATDETVRPRMGNGRSAVGSLGTAKRTPTTTAFVKDDLRNDVTIQPGDQVQISVWGYPEFTSTVTVNENNAITLPLIGEIVISPATKEALTTQLHSRLSEYIKEDVKLTVNVTSFAGRRVSVMGAVTRQDNYPVMAEISLVEIISTAGGTTADADLRHVKIYPNGIRRDPVEVDLTRHMQFGNMQTVPKVRPGDIVYVPREENLVRDLSGFMRDVLVLFGFFSVVR